MRKKNNSEYDFNNSIYYDRVKKTGLPLDKLEKEIENEKKRLKGMTVEMMAKEYGEMFLYE